MTFNPDSHHRQSIRLREYDYSQSGAYFVTICVQGRECLFGDISDEVMTLNEAGAVVEQVWARLPERFPNVLLDEFAIMPNHVHGIVVINEHTADASVGAIHELPLPDMPLQRLQRRAMLIPKIVGYFKMNTAKQINLIRDNSGVPVWQRNYYERIIRSGAELSAIRDYIRHNPQQWADDIENPVNLP